MLFGNYYWKVLHWSHVVQYKWWRIFNENNGQQLFSAWQNILTFKLQKLAFFVMNINADFSLRNSDKQNAQHYA